MLWHSGGNMAFQPFGYKFEVTSPSQVTEAKAIIRAGKKGWFDPNNGARGWICGPFICLWLSAFDSHGPMLFGLIRQDGFGTKISGRAGSDINGLLLTAVLLPLLVFLLFEAVMAEQNELGDIAILGGAIMLAVLCFWWAHRARREAEPLVRFLHDTITAAGRSLRATSAIATVSEGLTLDMGRGDGGTPASAMAIHAALVDLAEGHFVILSAAPENYIQAISRDGGFMIETRRGPGQHFQAMRRNASDADKLRFHFSFEEALAAFKAFASGTEMPTSLIWIPMTLSD